MRSLALTDTCRHLLQVVCNEGLDNWLATFTSLKPSDNFMYQQVKNGNMRHSSPTQSICMSCVNRITTINSLHSVNSMIFITAIQLVSVAVRIGTLNAIQPSFPLTATGEHWLAKYCHYFRFKWSNGQFCPFNTTGSTPASYSKGTGFKYLILSLNKPQMTHTHT